MDPTPPPAATADAPRYTVGVRGLAVASVALGYFSMLTFWWKPFGMCLAAVGFCLGVGSLAAGNRGGRHGENYALGGTILCGFVLGTTAVLYSLLGWVMWGYAPWPKVWGF